MIDIKRRESFEKWILSPHNSDGDSDLIFRDNDGEYYSAQVEERWEIYNSVLDSIQIDLPDWFDPDGGGSKALWMDLVIESINESGIKTK